MNLRLYPNGDVGISVDETTSEADVAELLAIFAAGRGPTPRLADLQQAARGHYGPELARTSRYLAHPVFNTYRSETDLLRYLHRLETRDLSLTTSMVPLGSCTMKLNATSEMIPVTWPEFSRLYPYAPRSQTAGYQRLFADLERWLAEITGFSATRLQPNAGAQGEYAGLLVIRAYHASGGDKDRDIYLIPTSAHGTNPASAALAGLRVVTVACDERGNVDVEDLRRKAEEHRGQLAALMIT